MSAYDASAESIKFAGEIVLRKMTLTSSEDYTLDIRDQVISVEVYEDMFAPFITMAVTLRESLDFINSLPLRGEEIIDVELSTPTFSGVTNTINGKFYIYKLSDRELLTERNSVYTLFCVSTEAMTDLNVKSSRSYKGNIGEIAAMILGKDGLNTTKNVNIEPTQNATCYVSNFWSPVRNMSTICNTAVNKNDSPTYVFFENKEGFNFVTLDLLYDQEVYQNFVKDDFVRAVNPNGTSSTRDIDREYQRIIEMRVPTNFDTIKNMNKGAYASRLYSYDLLRKKYFVKDYVAFDDFPSTNHVNNFSLYTSMMPTTPKNFIYNVVRHYSAFSGYNDTSNVDVMQARNSAINLLKSSMIEITVNGRTDYTVGMKVYIEVSRPAPMNNNDKPTLDLKTGTIDRTLSGNYLITAINNIINRDNHTCVIELCKDSFVE